MKTVLGAALLVLSAPVVAQTVPDLNVPDNVLGDERKFFVFHKAGVTLEQARADLGFCSRYIARGQQRFLLDFVAWKQADPAKPVPMSLNYGLMGVAIMAIIAGPIDRSVRQTRMMRCMLPR